MDSPPSDGLLSFRADDRAIGGWPAVLLMVLLTAVVMSILAVGALAV